MHDESDSQQQSTLGHGIRMNVETVDEAYEVLFTFIIRGNALYDIPGSKFIGSSFYNLVNCQWLER